MPSPGAPSPPIMECARRGEDGGGRHSHLSFPPHASMSAVAVPQTCGLQLTPLLFRDRKSTTVCCWWWCVFSGPVHLSDLWTAQTRLAPGTPAACSNPSCAKRNSTNNSRSSRFSNLLLPRLARSTLPGRFICCLFRCGGPPGEKKRGGSCVWCVCVCVRVRVWENGCDENDLAAVGRRRNSSCQPFHLSSTPHCC